MLLLGRHAATVKNENGGTDDSLTPLTAKGAQQARDMGCGLYDYLTQNNIRSLDVTTSGFVRTEATAKLAVQQIHRLTTFHGTPPIEIVSWVRDDRIGEIKFKPRDAKPTLHDPGFFGRQLDGDPRRGVLERLQAFRDDRLQDRGPSNHAHLVLGHRGANQIFAENIIRIRPELWIKFNCETWRLDQMDISMVHPGVKADRDVEDPRRIAFLNEGMPKTASPLFRPCRFPPARETACGSEAFVCYATVLA